MSTVWAENKLSNRVLTETVSEIVTERELNERSGSGGELIRDHSNKNLLDKSNLPNKNNSTKKYSKLLIFALVMAIIAGFLIIGIIIVCLLHFVFDLLPPKSTYSGRCENINICKSGLGLECINNTCTCDSTGYYWNGFKCTALLKNGEQCYSGSYQCSNTLKCINQKCSCSSNEFLAINNTCDNKYPHGSSCSSDSMCQDYNNLICDPVSSTCACINGSYYFDSVSGSCLLKVGYNSTCASTIECKNENLICQVTTIASSCPDSISLDRCSCQIGYYFNGLTCIPFESYYGECSDGCECDASLNLVCDTTLNRCVCSGTRYWSGTTCLPIKTYYASCSSSIECDASKGLSCSGSLCKCALFASSYWSSLHSTCFSCPAGWSIFDIITVSPVKQKCVKVFYSLVSWGSAKRSCEMNNARLIQISEPFEMSLLGSSGMVGGNIWVGGNSLMTNGVHSWSYDGSTISNFCSGEPTNNIVSENCNFFVPSSACMGDNVCSASYYYMCQTL